MKKIILLLAMITILSFLTSCDAGYVTEQPTYVETSRPIQPGADYIWIEGDWIWNSHSRTYSHGNGRWETPNRGKNYTPGHWNNSAHGYHWQNGRRH